MLSYSGTTSRIPAGLMSICLVSVIWQKHNDSIIRVQQSFPFQSPFSRHSKLHMHRLIWKLLCSTRAGANLRVQIWARLFQWLWKRKIPPSLTCMRICIWTHFKFLTVPRIRENLLRSDESFQNPVSHCSMPDVPRLCFLKPWLVFLQAAYYRSRKEIIWWSLGT